MDKYDRLTQEILTRAAERTPERAHFRVPELSVRFQMSDAEVEELFTDLHSRELIDVAAWDGEKDQSLHEWPNPNTVFHSPQDPNNVRVRIRIAGQRRLAELRGEGQRPDNHQIFISHIVQEKPLAIKLKEYIQQAFGPDIPIFVASDPTSIGGGRKWFEHIIANLRASRVILVLISQESAKREWINFEGGFGDGAGAAVIPIAIKDFTFNKLGFPLAGYNGREVGDIEGILFDIVRETGLTNKPVDTLQYREDVRNTEASLIYKSLLVEPYWDGQSIRFKITNRGNSDIDLLMLEAWVPSILHLPNAFEEHALDLLEYRSDSIDNLTYRYCVYTTVGSPNIYGIQSLRPVLTPSMGTIMLQHPKFKLNLPLPGNCDALNVHYHLHARNYDTKRETVPLKDVVKI